MSFFPRFLLVLACAAFAAQAGVASATSEPSPLLSGVERVVRAGGEAVAALAAPAAAPEKAARATEGAQAAVPERNPAERLPAWGYADTGGKSQYSRFPLPLKT